MIAKYSMRMYTWHLVEGLLDIVVLLQGRPMVAGFGKSRLRRRREHGHRWRFGGIH